MIKNELQQLLLNTSINSFSKVLKIYLSFCDDEKEMTPTKLAKNFQVNRSTIQRSLKQLKQFRLLDDLQNCNTSMENVNANFQPVAKLQPPIGKMESNQKLLSTKSVSNPVVSGFFATPSCKTASHIIINNKIKNILKYNNKTSCKSSEIPVSDLSEPDKNISLQVQSLEQKALDIKNNLIPLSRETYDARNKQLAMLFWLENQIENLKSTFNSYSIKSEIKKSGSVIDDETQKLLEKKIKACCPETEKAQQYIEEAKTSLESGWYGWAVRSGLMSKVHAINSIAKKINEKCWQNPRSGGLRYLH